IDVLPELPIPQQLQELEAAPAADVAAKIGLLNPIGYALLHERAPAVKAIAVVRREIKPSPPGPTYKAQLYTHRKTAIKKVDQIRGRLVAFGSAQSTSNFLVPAMMLWKAGIHPLNGPKRGEFAGGHDTAALGVYEGRAEVGAGHDGVISDLAGRAGYGDADVVLQNLAWSDPIPSDPVAIHPADAQLPQKITAALMRVAAKGQPDSVGNKAVKRFWGPNTDGFEAIDPSAYKTLLDQMKPLGLRAGDVLT